MNWSLISWVSHNEETACWESPVSKYNIVLLLLGVDDRNLPMAMCGTVTVSLYANGGPAQRI